jgi:predicted dehydrogenase
MSDTIRVGIVGAGAVVQVAHLPVIRKLKGVSVTALCDSDYPKAQAIAHRHGVPDAYDDIEELIGSGSVDAVVLCTPNHLHEAHVQAALAAGLHVLAEKPLAMDTAGVQKVVRAAERAAEKKGLVVMVGMNHRYRPDAQAIRSFVQSGELGNVTSVRGSWHVFRQGRGMLGWRRKMELAGGGAMLDLGLSILDLSFWLAGGLTPVRVSAALSRADRKDGVEEAGSAFVACEDGAAIFVDVTWHHVGAGERFGVGIRGTKGTASINPLMVWKEMHGTPVDVTPSGAGGRESQFTAAFRAEWAHFLAAIRGEAKPPKLEEQVVLHRVVDAIYASAESGRDVVL